MLILSKNYGKKLWELSGTNGGVLVRGKRKKIRGEGWEGILKGQRVSVFHNFCRRIWVCWECHSYSEKTYIGALYSVSTAGSPFPWISVFSSYLFICSRFVLSPRFAYSLFPLLVISTRLWRRPGAADFRQLAAVPCQGAVSEESTLPSSFLLLPFFFLARLFSFLLSSFSCISFTYLLTHNCSCKNKK